MQLNRSSNSVVSNWYLPLSTPGLSLFDDAFQEAKARFSSLSKDSIKLNLVSSSNSLKDVQDAITTSLGKYESQQKYPKIRKHLQSLSQRIQFYGVIVDVMVQQHPEYVSLVWGAMKFLFVAVINHEKATSKLAKALSQIADTLPQVELSSFLYPTERMKTAIVELNVHILRFLTRAHKWYQEGTFKHVIHSITQPVELRYDDILQSIAESSATVRVVAEASHQLELREIHGKIDNIGTAINDSSSLEIKLSMFEKRLAEISTQMSLQSTAMVNTNNHLSSMQFAQIMQSISDIEMGDPGKILEQLQISRRRQFTPRTPVLSSRFLNSPKLRSWGNSESSDISIIKGTFSSRQGVRAYCTDMLGQLRDSQIPAMFAMKTAHEELSPNHTSSVSIMKYLVRQGIQLQERLQTERSMSLNHVQFNDALTEHQWLQVLESILSSFNSKVYIIIDLEVLNQDFNWLSAFLTLFADLKRRQSLVKVKVLLISYTIEMPFSLTEGDQDNYVIHAKAGTVKRNQKKSKAKGRRR